MGDLSTSCHKPSLKASKRLAVLTHLQRTARGITRSTPPPPSRLSRTDTKGPLSAAAPQPDPGETCNPHQGNSRVLTSKGSSTPKKVKESRREGKGPLPLSILRLNTHIEATVACLLPKSTSRPPIKRGSRKREDATLPRTLPASDLHQRDRENALQRSRRHIRPSPNSRCPDALHGSPSAKRFGEVSPLAAPVPEPRMDSRGTT